MTVTPFPKTAMKSPPPPAPGLLTQPVHTHADVPQHVRLGASALHTMAAKINAGIGRPAATPSVLDDAEEKLLEVAERALALRHALVQERKRLAGRA